MAGRHAAFRFGLGRIPLGLRATLWWLAGWAVLPALVYSLWLCADARHEATRNEQLRATAALSSILARQANLVAETRTLLRSLSLSPVVRGQDRSACNAFLSSLLKDFPHYVTIGVIDADGWLGCSAIPPPAPLRLSDRGWFIQALATGGFVVGEHQISRLTGKSTVNFAYPFDPGDGNPRRVVAAAVDLGWLDADLHGLSLPGGAVFVLFDAQGTILARMPDAAPGFGAAILADLASKGLAGEMSLRDIAGQAMLLTYAPLPASRGGLFAAIGFPRSAAQAPANAMLTRHLFGVLVVVLLAIAATWLGGEALVLRPVRALRRATKALADGDLSARVGLPPGPGELRELGSAFDAMAGRLERDTLGRLEAENALRANCELLDSLFAAFPSPVFHKDIQGRYRGCNEAFARDILGLPREAVIGRTLKDLKERIPPALAAVNHERDMRLMTTGGVQRYEAPIRCADGTTREFHLSKAVYRDADNQVSGLVGVMVDISRLKDYERDLTRRLARNAALAELSKAVIARMDSIEAFTRLVLAKAREITESAHGYVASIDHDNGDLVVRTQSDMFPWQCGVQGEDRRSVFPKNAQGLYGSLWGHTLNTLTPSYTNDPARHPASRGVPEGHIRIERFLSVPAVFEGELVGQIALANASRPYTDEDRDVAMELARLLAVALFRGRLEAGLRASLREKEAMLREIHHRVKNNLQSIFGLLDLQAGQVEDAAARQAFEETRNRIAAMAQVHADIYASDDFAAIDLVAHARNLLLRLLGRLGHGRNIGVSVSGPATRLSLEPAVGASLVLNELVTNSFCHAFVARASGTIRIGVAQEGGQVAVTVRDDGAGLPEDFDLAVPGGLGLALAMGLAGQLGGTLTARNDGGAVFVLRFPVAGPARRIDQPA